MNYIQQRAIEIAESLVGIKERKPNRSPDIDLMQKAFGYLGVSYCAIFVLFCYKKAFEQFGIKYQFASTASSQTLFQYAKELDLIYTDPEAIKPGDIVIWRKWKLWQGHVGLITSNFLEDSQSFRTIEGNTSNSDFGSQSDGDGIYKRIRKAKKMDFSVDGFYIRGFIDMQTYVENRFVFSREDMEFRPVMEVPA